MSTVNLKNASSAHSWDGSHLIYKDEHHRDWGAVKLCHEALKLFEDTITVGYRSQLAQEASAVKEFLQSGLTIADANFPQTPIQWAILERLNIENFKIAAGFELVLKAILLEQNFVLHEIENKVPYKALSLEQKKRPIDKTEMFAVSNFKFNGEHNFLPGLKPSTLLYSIILKTTNYKNSLGLKDSEIDYIDLYRNLRNEIHFSMNPIASTKTIPRSNMEPPIIFIKNFVNSEIVKRANRLKTKHGFSFSLLPVLD